MTKLKICGLTAPEDIAAVNILQPDYIGFVFAPSKRRVSLPQAAALKSRLSTGIHAVGVFVNASIEDMASLANQGIIDLIQLHGDETDQTIIQLKKQTQAPIIKTVRVRTEADIVNAAAAPSDYLLFDTFRKDTYGGSGTPFDWSLIPCLNRPYFLAGGLNRHNIAQAVQTPAFCLDISSGVETNGHKDPDKIKYIMQIIKTIKEDLPWQQENLGSMEGSLSLKH